MSNGSFTPTMYYAIAIAIIFYGENRNRNRNHKIGAQHNGNRT